MEKKVQETELEKKKEKKSLKVETSKKRRRSSRGTPFKLQKTNTKENETIKKTNNNDTKQIEKEELEKVVKSRRTSRRSKRQTPVVDENKVHAKKAKTQHLARIPFSDVSEKENTISVSSGQQIIAPVDKNILREAEFYFSNSNLSVDKYLKKLSDSNEGWVSITTVASFQRMKKWKKKTIFSALRKSKEFLEV